ncbi:hypothetical protein OSTOST_23701 [Ostertagia ostertagi]
METGKAIENCVRTLGNRILSCWSEEEASSASCQKRTKISFMSRWTIPDDADLDAVETNLTEFGRLVIETPKTGLHTLKREVPIRFAPRESTTTEPSGVVVIN